MKYPKFRKPDFKGSFKTRSFRVGGYSVVATAIVLAIAIFANVLINAVPVKYTQLDTTSNQLFTISEQTEKILANLNTEVNVYWIVRDGREDSTLGLLLDRYEALSSNIKVSEKDPDVYPTFIQQYTTSVTDNSLIVEAGSRSRYVDYNEIYEYDYSNYYTNYSYDVSFAGESALTSAIDYVLNEDLPKIYTLTGHGESALSGTFKTSVEKENIETEELTLLTAESVPDDADAVLIYAPQSDIAEKEKEMLLSYLRSGGNLLLITDPPQEERLSNLEAVMEYYGVTSCDGIVVEGDRSHYAWETPYYLLPEMKSHTITSPLMESGYYVLLPIAGGLILSGNAPETATVTDLLATSDSAFSKSAGYKLTTYEKESGDIDGAFSLAVAVEDCINETETAHIVWISSSALLDDSTNQMVSGGNQDFFLNAIGWMCEQDESTISIRSKSLSYEYLTINSSAVSNLSLLIVGIIPISYLGIGIYTWVRRKRR